MRDSQKARSPARTFSETDLQRISNIHGLAFRIDPCKLAPHQPDLGMRFQIGHQSFQRLRFQHIIGVQKEEIFAIGTCMCCARVAGGANALIGLMHQTNSRILFDVTGNYLR